MEETNRQRKIAGVLQKDLVDVLQKAAQDGMKGVIISVSKVHVTADLGVAKVYLSVFPSENREEMVKGIQSNTVLIRHEMAKRTRNQLRRMPELLFFGDDTLDYIEEIDKSLKGNDADPIKNPDVLELLRAKYHVVSSYEFQVSRLTSDLISGYNRDIQLTKEPVMNGFSTTLDSLEITTLLFQNLVVNKVKCESALDDEIFATERVYKLVKKGIPFRDAYMQIAKTINKNEY